MAPGWSDSGEASTGGDSTAPTATDPTSPELPPSDSGFDETTNGQVPPRDEFADVALVQAPPSWLGAKITTPYDNALDYALAHAFFETYDDDYDFLTIYVEDTFVPPEPAWFDAHAVVVTEALSGIRFDDDSAWSAQDEAGSSGRLQQINFMASPRYYEPTWADIVIHETTHRWAAHVGLLSTPTWDYLLAYNGGHFNIHVSTGGPSATGYGDLVDLGGGNFRFDVIYPLRLSPLELYLAGLIPAAEVPPMFYVANPTNHEPAVDWGGNPVGPDSYQLDATFQGTRVNFTIDDIVAANGTRFPAFGVAPTHFRMAFLLVCADATQCDPADLALVEQQRVAFQTQFPEATGGRATVDTAL